MFLKFIKGTRLRSYFLKPRRGDILVAINIKFRLSSVGAEY